ncbi:hypothetical protein BDZ89DRAFT_902355, partial [Hymenopellis radicata]
IEKARRRIFLDSKGVGSSAVEDLLKSQSAIPIRNAFSEFFHKVEAQTHIHTNYFQLFQSESLHEWFIGVLKRLFIHLIRILHALGEAVLREFEARFRKISAFGRSSIRKFTSDVSEMKQFAARDYENLL